MLFFLDTGSEKFYPALITSGAGGPADADICGVCPFGRVRSTCFSRNISWIRVQSERDVEETGIPTLPGWISRQVLRSIFGGLSPSPYSGIHPATGGRLGCERNLEDVRVLLSRIYCRTPSHSSSWRSQHTMRGGTVYIARVL